MKFVNSPNPLCFFFKARFLYVAPGYPGLVDQTGLTDWPASASQVLALRVTVITLLEISTVQSVEVCCQHVGKGGHHLLS